MPLEIFFLVACTTNKIFFEMTKSSYIITEKLNEGSKVMLFHLDAAYRYSCKNRAIIAVILRERHLVWQNHFNLTTFNLGENIQR